MIRSAGRRRLVAALVALAGCAEPRTAAYAPHVHLVTLRHQNVPAPSMAAVPTAEVGGVRRPVLMAAPTELVLREHVPPGTVGRITRTVDVPEAFRGHPVRVVAVQAALAGAILDRLPDAADVAAQLSIAALEGNEPDRITATRVAEAARAVAAAAPTETIALDLAAAPGAHGSLLEVHVTRAPDPEWTTPPIAVPPGARLRFAMGLERPETVAVPPVTFSVAIVDEAGRETRIAERTLDPERRAADRVWVETEVALDGHAGRSIRLRFATAPRGAGLPRWGDPTIVVPPAPEPPARRNLLLVSLDTLRADRLGAWGYARPTSPALDALAAEGALFERAYAAFPRTDGSHGTMLTGLLPCVHGATELNRVALRADAITLAEHLRAAGWATGAVTEDALVTALTGFARGFDTWIEHKFAGGRTDARTTFADGRAWLDRHRARPWFLFLHTYQTHDPYRPPPGYLDRVAAEGGRDSLDSALYDAEIRYVDELLGDFLRDLAALGEADETIVVVVSDHGEHFGEHGLYGHSNSLYDELLHVPFVVRAPGLVPAGRRVPDPVGLVDLVPTVLELLDVPAPRWTHGRSLVPLLRGERLPPALLFAEDVGGNELAVHAGDRKWFVHRATGRVREGDLTADSAEATPRVRRVAGLRAAFEAQCAAPPAPVVDGAGAATDPVVEEKLRALGYVD